MDFTFIIQARLGSTRMPNKVILPFFNEYSIIDLLIMKLKIVSPNIILATSNLSINDELEAVANKHGIVCFRGSEDNVLKRFIDAAEKYDFKKIIRICSDNPFLDIDELIRLHNESLAIGNNFEYISYLIDESPSIKTHYGIWAEYVTIDALKKVASQTDEVRYKEHVTNFLYENVDLFKIKWLKPKVMPLKGSRLTVDTIDDFEVAKTIYRALANDNENMFPTTSSVYEFLHTHTCYLDSMKKQIFLNNK